MLLLFVLKSLSLERVKWNRIKIGSDGQRSFALPVVTMVRHPNCVPNIWVQPPWINHSTHSWVVSAVTPHDSSKRTVHGNWIIRENMTISKRTKKRLCICMVPGCEFNTRSRGWDINTVLCWNKLIPMFALLLTMPNMPMVHFGNNHIERRSKRGHLFG